MKTVRDYEWAQAITRTLLVALFAVTLVMAGGGCVSYSGCRTQEDRVRARYEQHFILPDDPSSTAFWKNTKHVFFDLVTCCFHEIWRGNARRAYRRLVQGAVQGQAASREREAKDRNESVQGKSATAVTHQNESATETNANEMSGTPTLGNAIGMTKAWDERKRAAEEDVRKRFFNGNDADYRRYLEWKTPSDVKQRDSIRRYEESQTRQFAKIQNAQRRQSDEERQKSVIATENASALSELAEKQRTAKDKCELAEKAQDRDRRLDEIQKERDDALAKAKEEYDARLAANRQRLRDWYEESLRKETKFQQSCGLAGETGFNVAVDVIGKDARAMLCALVDAGQVDFVQTLLDELTKPDAGLKKVLRKDAQGSVLKDAKGRDLFDWEYNPQGRLCMTLSQVKEVQDYLDQRVQAEEARKRRTERRESELGKSDGARQGPGTGTGWFVNGKCVATCWHVVKGAKTVKVEFPDGCLSSARIVAKDEDCDVAVLEVKNPPKGQLSLPIRTHGVKLSDKMFTIGYPLPDLLGQAQKYTEGSISAMDGIAGDSRHFQISTPIQPGNSGGPLADESGRVVGLTSGILNAVKTAKATGALPQNVNYAVKARYLAMVLDGAGIDYVTQGSDSDADKNAAVERVVKATCLVIAE